MRFGKCREVQGPHTGPRLSIAPVCLVLPKGKSMHSQTPAARPPAALTPPCACTHELRFESLFHPGRGVVVPCDATGRVDMDVLTERLRNAYLGARAMVGREYAFPRVQPSH